jgi:hypothetical protein
MEERTVQNGRLRLSLKAAALLWAALPHLPFSACTGGDVLEEVLEGSSSQILKNA